MELAVHAERRSVTDVRDSEKEEAVLEDDVEYDVWSSLDRCGHSVVRGVRFLRHGLALDATTSAEVRQERATGTAISPTCRREWAPGRPPTLTSRTSKAP
jgi:hypothetical protein